MGTPEVETLDAFLGDLRVGFLHAFRSRMGIGEEENGASADDSVHAGISVSSQRVSPNEIRSRMGLAPLVDPEERLRRLQMSAESSTDKCMGAGKLVFMYQKHMINVSSVRRDLSAAGYALFEFIRMDCSDSGEPIANMWRERPAETMKDFSELLMEYQAALVVKEKLDKDLREAELESLVQS